MSFATILAGLFACSNANYKDLDADAFANKISEEGVALVDVRTAEEFAEGHLAGAANIDWYREDFLQRFESGYSKDTPLAIYCRSGRRSAEAAAKLTEAGYSVFNLASGYIGWTGAGKPVTRYEVETFRTEDGEPVAITLIKHGTLAVSYKDISIQIDPVSEHGKHTDYASEFPKADIILITHEHGDHLDDSAVKALEKDGTRLILNQKSADQLRRGKVLRNGESVSIGEIRIDAVPAYNTTPGRENFHPKGSGNGYVLTIGSFRIYIAGDTEYIDEFSGIKDIDVALLPVNQPYTMTVEQCVKAAETIAPKVLIPYHFGQTDLSELPGRLPEIKVLLRQMQ